MAVFINPGDTIEGNAIDFVAKAWRKTGPIEHPLTKKTMYRYTTDRTSTATITKACPSPTDDDIKAATEHYHREEGDQLKADALEIFTEGVRPMKVTVLGGVSGRHKSQVASSTTHTIATIKTPLSTYIHLLGYTSRKMIKG